MRSRKHPSATLLVREINKRCEFAARAKQQDDELRRQHVAHLLERIETDLAQNNYAEAELLFKRVLAFPGVAQISKNYATLLREAEPLLERFLAIREKALGPDHPDVAKSLTFLAVFHQTQGSYAEAEPLYERSLAIVEKSLGPEHPRVAQVLENYATLLRKTGRSEEAVEMEARAKAILRPYFRRQQSP